MFYDNEKTRDENSEQNQRTNHNRNAILLLTALAGFAAGVISLAVVSKRAAEEFL